MVKSVFAIMHFSLFATNRVSQVFSKVTVNRNPFEILDVINMNIEYRLVVNPCLDIEVFDRDCIITRALRHIFEF